MRKVSIIVALSLAFAVTFAQDQRNYTRADFINVEGSNLNDKIDSIDVFITTDTTYHAAGNGKLVESQIAGSNVTYHWRHRYPIAHYLISTAIADYEVRHDTIHLPGGVNVPMLTYNYTGAGYDACRRTRPGTPARSRSSPSCRSSRRSA